MANDYTTTQLQLTRNYLDGDIKSESIAAPDMADQDFVVEDNGDQVTQPAGGEAGCVGYNATKSYENEYRNNADDLIIDNVSLSNPSNALAGDVDGDSDFALWEDVRDYNHGSRSNWDVICDVGTALKQTSAADALTNYRPEGIGLDHPVFEDGALERRFGGGSNAHALTQKVQHGCFEIQSGFSTEKLDLRSDIRFVIEPVNLVQGLDAAGLNNPEGIGLDHPIFDVVNKVVSSLQPANEFI